MVVCVVVCWLITVWLVSRLGPTQCTTKVWVFIFQKYVAVGELGKATDTLDATGSVILEKDFGNTENTNPIISSEQVILFCSLPFVHVSHCFCWNIYTVLLPFHGMFAIFDFYPTEHITSLDIEEKLKSFTGDIMQVPPLWVRPLIWENVSMTITPLYPHTHKNSKWQKAMNSLWRVWSLSILPLREFFYSITLRTKSQFFTQIHCS